MRVTAFGTVASSLTCFSSSNVNTEKPKHENKDFPAEDLDKLRKIYHVLARVGYVVKSSCDCWAHDCIHREWKQILTLELPSYFCFDFMNDVGMYDDDNFREEIKASKHCDKVFAMEICKKPHRKSDTMQLLKK